MLNQIYDNKTRWRTGFFLLAAVFIIGLIDNFLLTWLVLGLIFIVAIYEFSYLIDLEDPKLYPIAILLWVVAASLPHPSLLIMPMLLIAASILAYYQNLSFKYFYILLYPTLPFLVVLSLYNVFAMPGLIILLLTVVASDVGAYVIGKKFGKRPFCPTSPNKTLEGYFGGLAFGVLFHIIGNQFFSFLSFGESLIIGLLVTLAAVFGDLFESYIKRQAQVKDSGTILPGHGGILDRIDSYLFAAVAFYFSLNIVQLS